MEHDEREGAGEAFAPSTHYTKFALTARGWTRTMITRLLGTPDKVSSRCGERSFHYVIERVHAAEQTPAFARQKARAHRTPAQAAVNRARRNATLEAIATITFPIPALELAELTRRAIAAYNRTMDCPPRRASTRSDPTFLAYLCVHWLCHQCPEYSRAIASTKGKSGRWEAYYHARRRLLDVIATAYPHLADECAFQRSQERGPEARSYVTVDDLEDAEPNPNEVAERFAAKRLAAGIPEFPDRVRTSANAPSSALKAEEG